MLKRTILDLCIIYKYSDIYSNYFENKNIYLLSSSASEFIEMFIGKARTSLC